MKLINRGKNLYMNKESGKYYRLFAKGITPNGCWLVAPKFIELVDIDTATGQDVYGDDVYSLPDVTGTVSSYIEFITSN